MKKIDSELRQLSELYSRLDTALKALNDGKEPADPAAVVRHVLRNRELFALLERMNARLLQLAGEWEEISPRLSPEERRRIQEIACKLRGQAAGIAGACEKCSTEVEMHRAKVKWKLGRVVRGAKYLESLRPLKVNYPKFFDSQG